MKIFQKVLMASEDVKSYLVTGVFETGEFTGDTLEDGAAVVIGGLVDHDVYDGIKDLNTRKLTKPAAITDKVGFVDYVGVSEANVMGVTYRVGDKVAGLSVPLGTKTRVRIPQIGDMFWLGADNFVSTPTVGQYAKTTASDTRMTPAASVDEDGATYLAIEDEKNVITGTVNDGKMYLCHVVALA